MDAFHDDKESFIFLGIVWRYAIIKYIIWPLVARYCTVVVLTLLLSVCWCVNIRSGVSSLLEPDLLGITSQMCIEGILKHGRDILHIKCMEQYCASCRAYIVTVPAEKSITAVPWDDCKTNEISVFVLFRWALKHSDWFHCKMLFDEMYNIFIRALNCQTRHLFKLPLLLCWIQAKLKKKLRGILLNA